MGGADKLQYGVSPAVTPGWPSPQVTAHQNPAPASACGACCLGSGKDLGTPAQRPCRQPWPHDSGRGSDTRDEAFRESPADVGACPDTPREASRTGAARRGLAQGPQLRHRPQSAEGGKRPHAPGRVGVAGCTGLRQPVTNTLMLRTSPVGCDQCVGLTSC